MKTLKLMLAFAAFVLTATSCSQKKEAPKSKVLVLYYSQTSNTKTVAQELANKLGADMEEIVAKNPYNGDFQATIARCQQEREQGVTPEIEPIKADLAQYDVIFLGYPVWFGTYAPPMAAFLNQVDLSGKKIVPFCTFGSGGLDSSVKDMAKAQPNAEIVAGYGVRAARMAAVPSEVDQFLKAGGFIEGEYTKLEEFPEQQPVTEEQTAIFDKAVGDYQMIHAKATTVASRAVPGGTEYLFNAVDLPREGAPQPAAPGELKVYVLALDGESPVFTQVVR